MDPGPPAAPHANPEKTLRFRGNLYPSTKENTSCTPAHPYGLPACGTRRPADAGGCRAGEWPQLSNRSPIAEQPRLTVREKQYADRGIARISISREVSRSPSHRQTEHGATSKNRPLPNDGPSRHADAMDGKEVAYISHRSESAISGPNVETKN